MAQTSYGTITITDTTDIESIVVEYAQNQDPLTAPINGWGTTRPEWAEGYYIWQRTRTHKYGTSSSADDIGVAVCITGSQGETGRSLTSTITQYTTAASSATITTDNMGDYIWYTNIPPYNNSTPVYWVRVTNIYSNPSTGYLDVYSGEVVDGSGSSNGSNSSSQNNSENNITTVYIIYKDEGLTSAVSMSQTALTQSSSNINTIIRLWYRSNSATAPSKPTSHITQSGNNVDNTWTTTKPIDKDGYRYYYYCDELCTGGGVYKWTDVVLDTSNLSQYEIGALTTKVKNFWWDTDGAHVASGKNGSEVTTESSSTYGYNSLMGLTGISFGYDDTKVVDLTTTSPALNFYLPPVFNNNVASQGNKVMQLSNNALTFYNPSDGTTAYATLNANGLKLAKGGIQSVTSNQSGFIYLSTDNYGNYSINNSSGISDWKQIIGTKFGVRADGTLYASNANISGTITIGSGSNVYTKTEADNAFDASGDAAAAQAAAIAAAATDATNKANAAQANAIAEIGNATAGKADNSMAVYREQRIYRRYTSAQSNLSGPTTWITTNSDTYSDWTTKVPQLTNDSTKYPYLYTCIQKQTVAQYNNGSGTSCTCTEVLLDDTTTVIDGGALITGSVTANEITGNKLSAIYADMGNITAGNITKGNNSINFDNSPATLEFKNASTWSTATQGIKYDSDGLAIKGAITATSLTIGSGSDAYDGTAAINISGYDIEIEKNGTDEVEGVSVYLYPILYHNGIQVPTIEVDYSHFIWYQDDDTIGTEGDENNSGRYLATYGHNYRVIYDFDDGAVGGGTEVVDRTIDPSKYITKISDTGITVHPEIWTNQSSYIQLDGSGLNLFDITGTSIAQYGNTIRVGKATENHLEIDNNGISILNNTNSLANFGSTARIGLNNSSRFLMNSNSLEAYNNNNNKYFEITTNSLKVGLNNSSRFLMNSDSLEAYDSNNNKYFEINSDNLSWGNNVAATTVGLASAARTATNYITYVNSTDGIKIHDDTASTSYTKINSNGMQIYKNGDEVASFGQNVRLGLNDEGNIYITSNSLALRYEQDRLFEASYDAGSTNFYFASSSLVRDILPASGCKYLNSEANAILNYLNNNCHSDFSTLKVLDSNNQVTEYTLRDHTVPGSNFSTYDVLDADGDEIICGDYNGIFQTSDHNDWYDANVRLHAMAEIPGYVNINACDGQGKFKFSGKEYIFNSEDPDVQNSSLTKLKFGGDGSLVYNALSYSGNQAQIQARCDSNAGVWIGVGSGGVNHGLYSAKTNKWLIFGDANTDRSYTQGHFGPNTTSTSTSTGYYLGWSANRWRQLYSYSAVNTASDKKYKDVISNIEYAKDLIMGLEPIEFQWKDSDHRRSHMGFIAQDAAQVGKDLNKNLSFYEAHYNDGADYHGEDANDEDLEWSMMYDELIAPLVKVVQEQQKEIDELKLKVNALTGK